MSQPMFSGKYHGYMVPTPSPGVKCLALCQVNDIFINSFVIMALKIKILIHYKNGSWGAAQPHSWTDHEDTAPDRVSG